MKKLLFVLFIIPFFANAQSPELDEIYLREALILTDSSAFAISSDGDTLATLPSVREEIEDSLNLIVQSQWVDSTSGIVYVGGYVGIGTADPLSALHINKGTGSLSTGITFTDGTHGIYQATSSTIDVRTGGSFRFRFGNPNQSVDILPVTTNVYDLGSSVKNWDNLWINDINNVADITFNINSVAALVVNDAEAHSVAGIANYETLVIADDDIPNKKYVDDIAGGGGDVYKTGTPLDDQFAVFTNDSTIEGISTFTQNTSGFEITGQVSATGGIDAGDNGDYLKFKKLEIGDWDMDASTNATVAHGLTFSNIINVLSVDILNDGSTSLIPLDYSSGTVYPAGRWSVGSTNITLSRTLGGIFDDVLYDATSFNRGYIIIIYE